ncbi:MAG: protein kinase [Chloracidobacterium sp.]|nr:protein kinase [Chloracidobacterium sp.]
MEPKRWQLIKDILATLLEVDESERGSKLDAACGDDDELRSEVLAYIALSEDDPETRSTQVGKYQLIEKLGEGGMGEVWLAADRAEGYERQVAVKLIKVGPGATKILERFLTERRILSGLSHPNIARMLDGGRSDDGQPYLVMEYVQGVPISDYVARERLECRDIVKLFILVCRAVAHAHSNLIVHRDLKPSNVLVTADAEPKLLDFGISKILDIDVAGEESGVTFTRMLMTPAYASPEQLRGESPSTAADVYSLGIVLFELVTGSRPFGMSSDNPVLMYDLVRSHEPERPSSVLLRESGLVRNRPTSSRDAGPVPSPIASKDLEGDLDNVVLKAIDFNIAQRYQTVQEFSDDLQRYVDGMPVLASAGSRTYRLRKFIGRHRSLAIAWAAFVLVLLGATATTSWLYVRAGNAQIVAERRFNDVRKLANSIVFELHDSILDLPGSTPTREVLVSRALEYLDELSASHPDDPKLQMELADAYEKIGDVQGGLFEFHLGQREKAAESYRKAFAIRERLVLSAPNSLEFRRKLAASLFKLGNMLWVETKMNESLEAYRQALDIYDSLGGQPDAEVLVETAKTLTRIGYVKAAGGDLDGGDAALERAYKLLNEARTLRPSDISVLMATAGSLEASGTIENAAKQNFDSARSLYANALVIWKELYTERPNSVIIKRGLARSYHNLALAQYNIAWKSGTTAGKVDALKSVNTAHSAYAEMATSDPSNQELRRQLSDSISLKAKLLIEMGQIETARSMLLDSRAELESMWSASPADETLQINIASMSEELGYSHLASARSGSRVSREHTLRARDYFEQSLKTFRSFRDAGKLVGTQAKKAELLERQIAECDELLSRAP